MFPRLATLHNFLLIDVNLCIFDALLLPTEIKKYKQTTRLLCAKIHKARGGYGEGGSRWFSGGESKKKKTFVWHLAIREGGRPAGGVPCPWAFYNNLYAFMCAWISSSTPLPLLLPLPYHTTHPARLYSRAASSCFCYYQVNVDLLLWPPTRMLAIRRPLNNCWQFKKNTHTHKVAVCVCVCFFIEASNCRQFVVSSALKWPSL